MEEGRQTGMVNRGVNVIFDSRASRRERRSERRRRKKKK